jgi:flagellar hook assembly protein FlgD
VELGVYDVNGRLVRSLLHGAREAGSYQITWDGHDESGHTVAAGVYYARLLTPQGNFVRSLVYLR